jgi:diguanylate cyclase (GGDEF)-like protein/PAS domain S-box-containing protein
MLTFYRRRPSGPPVVLITAAGVLAVVASALGTSSLGFRAGLLLVVFAALSVGNTVLLKVPYSRTFVAASDVLLLVLVLRGEGLLAVAASALAAGVRLSRFERGAGAVAFVASLASAATFVSTLAVSAITQTWGVGADAMWALTASVVAAALIHAAVAAGPEVVWGEGAAGAGAFGLKVVRAFAWPFTAYLAAASLAGICVAATPWVGEPAILSLMAAALVAHFAYSNRAGRIDARADAGAATARMPADDGGLQAAFDHALIGAAIVSARGEFLRVNRALCDYLGRAEGDLVGAGLQSVTHADDIGQVLSGVKDFLRGGAAGGLEVEVRQVLKGGGLVWAHWSVGKFEPAMSDEPLLVLQVQDITERKLSEQQLLHDAFHDALTGLPNRALFIDHVKLAISRGRRRGGGIFAVIFIDLDRFKVVNDSLGHMAGDQLLVSVARRIESCLRDGDTVARVGGDEFTVLLEDLVDVGEAIGIAERIQREVSAAYNIDGHEVFTTLSMGVAPGGLEYEDPEDILRDADTAMYRAKSLGKARHEVFDTAMHARAINLLQMETDMRKAVERNEFFLVYQPIVGLDDFSICGFEALIRWQHPERGLISPMDFIPVAEETGQVIVLGEWALWEACRQMQQWHRRFPLQSPFFISVNLSTKQFSASNLVERVGEILRETALNPRSLKLEITESAVMENIDKTAELLRRLRALGVQLSIDDFGTGYSSLSYLHRFPIDTLKIDRSFVMRMVDHPENAEIVRTIVMLAQTLGMDVVAEGVETKEQLNNLRQLGCEYGQGYYFSKPLGSAEAERIIADTCEPKPDRGTEVLVNDRVKSIRLIPSAQL